MRGQAVVVEGLRKELSAVRAELTEEQGRAEQERSARVLAEDLAERRQGQVDTLQAQVNHSFQEEVGPLPPLSPCLDATALLSCAVACHLVL